MRSHGYQSYFDNEVLAASPLKLIQMLYSAALDSIAAARRHVRHKNIRARTRAVNKAIGIVSELYQCLDYEAGGALSWKLAGLYDYIVCLLIKSNLEQIEAPLAEAEGLLSTLGEAWTACIPTAPEYTFPPNELFLQDASTSDPSLVAP